MVSRSRLWLPAPGWRTLWKTAVFLVLMAFVFVSAQAQSVAAKPWPRSFDVDGLHMTLHQPQLDGWDGNQLKGRIAVAVKTGQKKDADGKSHDTLDYGVLWFTARTETDKVRRQVTLSAITADKVSFPTDAANQPRYLGALTKIAARGGQVVDLDQLEASMAIAREARSERDVALRNDPPDIVFSFQPSLLVLIDGSPVLKPSGTAGVERVINTRSLLLRKDSRYYVAFANRWASALAIDGPWTLSTSVPAGLDALKAAAVKAGSADVMAEPAPALKKALDDGIAPNIVVSSKPAELIMVEGNPTFVDIPGTQLAFVANTGSDVFVDKAHDQTWYVLISGRWFSAPSSKGPWQFVDGHKLPADFAAIPSDSPKSAVLASVPGTPEARESLIANSVPQTATVDRIKASLHTSYDGSPQFKPIDGTSLQYAWNTAVPVIRVSGNSFYAVQNGIWFSASSPAGPWSVALEVPADIYAIPASSPLHYVTYVYVYGHDGNTVYVGYTPGYYGTVVSGGTVVYGTGYACDAWVGNVWYGCPATYGFGVAFGWDAYAGWSFGFAWGAPWASAWYGPWWGPWGYYPGYYPGYWGGGIAAANVYGRWGNSVVRGVGAEWANPWTGNYGRAARGGYVNQVTGGRGVGYAGWNTNAYTGTTTARAGGMRYNPQTGRVVAGQGGIATNPYTGNSAAGGSRTVVNTQNGRVTNEAGVAGRNSNGAGAAGTFNSNGAQGNAHGAGYVNYDKNTGTINHGGVANINDQIYAGKDGNVYHYQPGQGWQPAGSSAHGDAAPADSADIDRDRMARDRGADMDNMRQNNTGAASQFDRSNYDNRFQGHMGGQRQPAGGGRFGGGGGFRRH